MRRKTCAVPSSSHLASLKVGYIAAGSCIKLWSINIDFSSLAQYPCQMWRNSVQRYCFCRDWACQSFVGCLDYVMLGLVRRTYAAALYSHQMCFNVGYVGVSKCKKLRSINPRIVVIQTSFWFFLYEHFTAVDAYNKLVPYKVIVYLERGQQGLQIWMKVFCVC
jgi:hypothetical protein